LAVGAGQLVRDLPQVCMACGAPASSVRHVRIKDVLVFAPFCPTHSRNWLTAPAVLAAAGSVGGALGLLVRWGAEPVVGGRNTVLSELVKAAPWLGVLVLGPLLGWAGLHWLRQRRGRVLFELIANGSQVRATRICPQFAEAVRAQNPFA
jgi:hypothetical protein